MLKNGVTVYIPVYNEQDKVERAVRSVVDQCQFVLIGDNASTDNTESVCRKLAQEFPHVQYLRRPENIGSLENGRSLLGLVQTDYCMCLGSHDYIGDSSIKPLVEILKSDQNVALAAGAHFHYIDTEQGPKIHEDVVFNAWGGVIQDLPEDRLRKFLFDDANTCCAIYGLFRTKVLQEASKDFPLVGSDTILLAKTAFAGKILISHDSQYYTWDRIGGKKEDYFDRHVRLPFSKRASRQLANEFRAKVFELLLNSERPKSGARRLQLRLEVMIRYGVFKLKNFDPVFYMAYIPVKVANELRRLKRKVDRGVRG